MKKTLVVLAILLAVPLTVFAGQWVSGHWRDTNHDGVKDTYISPYERTPPNDSRTDNYSYPNNYNPNTGRTTSDSNSQRELYPSNPNPYEHKRNW